MNTRSQNKTGSVRSPPQTPLRVQQPPAQTTLQGDLSSPDVIYWNTGSDSDRLEVRLADIERNIGQIKRELRESTTTWTNNIQLLTQFSQHVASEVTMAKQALCDVESRFNKTESILEALFERIDPVIVGLVSMAREMDPEEANKFKEDFDQWFEEVTTE